MNKKHMLFTVIVIIFALLVIISPKVQAQDLDEIVNYVVTVDPRMNDGSLDITYEITWEVLDDTSEGPLEWVQIGTPNEHFDTAAALTSNIKSITKYNGSYVKIVFDKKYYAGDQITFKYKIHQSYMYKISSDKCAYSFTPAWFTDAKVDQLTVKWNMDKVQSNNSNSKEDNYLIWNKTNMAKGEKLTANIEYEKSAFSYLDEQKQSKESDWFEKSFSSITFILLFILFGFVYIGSIFSLFARGGYRRHRGFYGDSGRHHYRRSCVHHSSCVHSSCAHSSCAHSCACACAGSGRAGCSRKDFYGTKINKDKLKIAMQK